VTIASPYINELRNLSVKLGRDPLLVQAASGNTSIKLGDELWIKASGKWLADAGWDEIFVPVDRNTLEASGGTLSPSIETAMHLVLPHQVVIHVHSVNAISWAVREDGRARVAERLAGLSWAWIPYVPSGEPLAREIHRARTQCSRLQEKSPDVFLLANHGLVVAADDCDSADALLADVERRLEVVPRDASGPDRAQLAGMSRGSGFHPPAESEVHCLATDNFSLSILRSGTLFPCHALFLGPATAECDVFEPVSHSVERYERQYGSRPSNIAVRGEGLLVTDELTVTQMQVLVGLAHVIQRIEQGAQVRYLTQEETAELLTTDAYRYRENVEARAALASR
jgi:rhamnose utilization protein RhaD (predicted bifunctional aldolase and dehydrogenase)